LRVFVRIRIYGIIGFSGFARRVFDRQALSHICLDGSWDVRIRIYGIIGFSGFSQRIFDRQALIRIRLDGIYSYGEKREWGEAKS